MSIKKPLKVKSPAARWGRIEDAAKIVCDEMKLIEASANRLHVVIPADTAVALFESLQIKVVPPKE